MGFDREIASILNALNEQAPERQTILLSATLTDDVKRLAGIALRDPKLVDIAQDMSGTGSIKQIRTSTENRRTEVSGDDESEEKRTRNTGVEDTGDENVSLELGTVSFESEEVRHSDFTTPEGLQQHFVIVPSKMRLVTLTAFILWRCTVSLSYKLKKTK